MVEGKRKSRTLRRVFVRTPGGETVIHYKARKPSRPHCASCGTVLHGMKATLSRAMHSMPKTMKRPERPYGGMLCSTCMRRTIIEHIQR
jgi:large subunit ribosomal protein L34e